MVETETRMGPKGQILIPKLLREEYNIFPGDELILKEGENGILIEKQIENPIQSLRTIAKKYNKKININNYDYESVLGKRWKATRKK